MADEPAPSTRTTALGWLTEKVTSTRGLVAVGLTAVVVALLLGWLTWLDLRGTDEGVVAEPATVETERTVSRRGGFAVAVPTDMEVRRRGRTVQLVGADPQLVVNVGPAPVRRLGPAHRGFLRTLERRYDRVRVIGRERGDTGGRRSVTTAGTALNEADVPIRFVAVTLAARPRAYTLVAFTERDAPPAEVLPRLNAIVDGFELLPR